MKIPQPRKRFALHSELHRQMKPTHRTEAEFHKFKHNVRESSRYLQLVGQGVDPTSQQWRKLIELVLLEEPSLNLYDECWPVRHYALAYIRDSNKRALRRPKDSQDPQRRGIANESVSLLNRSRRRTVPAVIDLEVIELTSREGTPLLESRSSTWHAPSSRRFSTYESHRTKDMLGVGSSTSTLIESQLQNRFPILRNQGSGSQKSHLRSRTTFVGAALCCFCQCGPPMEVNPFLNDRLAQIIDDSCTLKTLQSFGICFDQHLDFLVGLDDAAQLEIVDLIPLEKMNALDKFKLLKIIRRSALRNVQEDGIPQSINAPSKHSQEYAVMLADSKEFQGWLQYAMALEHDNAIFQDILRIMEAQSMKFFCIQSPVIDHLRATIRTIVEECPMYFRHYPAYWPIRLYLGFRQEMLGCTIPQYDIQREQEAFRDVFDEADILTDAPVRACSEHSDAREPHTVVTVEQVPCRKHPSVDITAAPAELRTHLHAFGVTELLPALVHIGIRTEEDMLEFSRMSAQERSDVMNIGKLKLGMLQKYMLELVCKQQ